MVNIDWIELLINILLASFGGIVKRLVDLDKNPRKQHKVGLYVTAAVISLFVGIVIYIICKNYEAPPLLIMGATAIAGFLGAPIINLIADFSLRQFKLIDKKKEEEEEKKKG